MRWAIKLSAFRYVAVHLPGEDNVWAGTLTCWAMQPKNISNSSKATDIKQLILAPVRPSLDMQLN